MSRTPLYREWPVEAPLRPYVACIWTGEFADDGEPFTDRVLPDGCVDIVWMQDRLVVAGPDTRAMPLARAPGARLVGVRFRPGVAPCFLGVPSSELLDTRVEAAELLGDRAPGLADRVRGAASLAAAAREVERELTNWLPRVGAPDRLVQGAVAMLHGDGVALPVGGLAQTLGVSERQLLRRFVHAVGYGPKVLQRVLRLQRFVALALEPGRQLGLGRLAHEAGYVDQAHLTHECNSLAGVSPAILALRPAAVASLNPGPRR